VFFGQCQGEGDLAWPEVAPAAVEVASALERLSHDSLGNDLHKYNLKMRQLDFNVKVHSLYDHESYLSYRSFFCEISVRVWRRIPC
jgi:hypothetical protein